MNTSFAADRDATKDVCRGKSSCCWPAIALSLPSDIGVIPMYTIVSASAKILELAD